MFESIVFYTNKLKLLRRFYGNVMELDITKSNKDRFTVTVGETDLTFNQSDQPSFYHFAINIPGNQFSIMKSWIEDRLTLNQEGGIDEIYYPSFDADAMYLEDPAGNLIELIGRRKRDMFGSLTSAAFLDVSEVGIVTPFVMDVGDQLQDFGIPLWQGTEVDPESVNFLGKGDTFLVLAPPARRWEFSKKDAETHPLEITLNNGNHIIIDKDGKIALSQSEEAD